MFPLKKSGLEIEMKKVPIVSIVIGSTLSDQTETVPSSGRAVALLVPGKLVLKTATNPTRFELGKVTVFINLHSEDPATGEKINVATKLATVSKANSVIVQVRLELLQFSSANFLPVLLLHSRSDSTRFDLILLSQPRRKPITIQGTKEGSTLKFFGKRIKTSWSPAASANKLSSR